MEEDAGRVGRGHIGHRGQEEEQVVTPSSKPARKAKVVPDFPAGFGASKVGPPPLSPMPGYGGMVLAEGAEEVSPPRYTAPILLDASLLSMGPSQAKGRQGRARVCMEGEGRAVCMADAELVELLKRPPKTTMVLRTRTNFQEFFQGMPEARIRSLLNDAYGEIEDAAERSVKINKRMDLLQGVLT
jgi:hypothetical protein